MKKEKRYNLIEQDHGETKIIATGTVKELVEFIVKKQYLDWILDEDPEFIIPDFTDVTTEQDMQYTLKLVDLWWWSLTIKEVDDDRPVYHVRMIKGTEDAWDETHTDPETIFTTLDREEAEKVAASTPIVPLDDHDLSGKPYFLAPAIIRVWDEEEELVE